MLKKSERLRKDREITLLYRKGRRLHSPHFSITHLFRPTAPTRVAFVVSKAISKKSVVRNKLRRRLSEVMKRELRNVKSTFDLAVSAKKGAEALSFKALEDEIASVVARLPKK